MTDDLSSARVVDMARNMGLDGPTQAAAEATSSDSLYMAFIECDCTTVESSPFAEPTDGRVNVCDAKGSFDDNAELR